jgi:hypothetical protein
MNTDQLRVLENVINIPVDVREFLREYFEDAKFSMDDNGNGAVSFELLPSYRFFYQNTPVTLEAVKQGKDTDFYFVNHYKEIQVNRNTNPRIAIWELKTTI